MTGLAQTWGGGDLTHLFLWGFKSLHIVTGKEGREKKQGEWEWQAKITCKNGQVRVCTKKGNRKSYTQFVSLPF